MNQIVGYYRDGTTLCRKHAQGRDLTAWEPQYAANGTNTCSVCGYGLEDDETIPEGE